MKAFGKLIGIIALVLLLLIVAAGFVLTHLFDPNDYKDEIRQLARDKANLELNLKGDIGWSLFPWLGLELHDTSMASAADPGQAVCRPPVARPVRARAAAAAQGSADERYPRRRPDPFPDQGQGGRGQLGKHRQARPAPGPPPARRLPHNQRPYRPSRPRPTPSNPTRR